jgi:putative ABC transport system permease protein
VKYLFLIWAGIWRKRGRTILIILQISVAFALFGVLQGLKTGVDEAIAKTRADLLFVVPSAFGGAPLPLGCIDRLRSIPGVGTVTFADGFLGTYQKPTESVYVLAIESNNAFWLTLVPEIFKVLPADLEALQRTRTGVLISADIGKKYGWHIGDRIPLASTTLQSNGSGDWVFDVVGTFTAHEPGSDGYIVANYAYFDEARRLYKGTVRNFYVVASDPKQAAAVAETIDRTFANSSGETKTASLRENAQQQMQSIGNLSFAIRSIVSAVLVTLLFSNATMMMQSIRERTPELAILKTLGFTNRAVFCLVLAEAIIVCIVAAVIGLALATIVFPYAGKYVPGLSMPWVVVEIGLLAAVGVALVSAAVPAVRAARLEIVDALAGR